MSESTRHRYILPLADAGATLIHVGGKGASLARLVRAGLPVPGGFHITTKAYRVFVEANQLQSVIEQALMIRHSRKKIRVELCMSHSLSRSQH